MSFLSERILIMVKTSCSDCFLLRENSFWEWQAWSQTMQSCGRNMHYRLVYLGKHELAPRRHRHYKIVGRQWHGTVQVHACEPHIVEQPFKITLVCSVRTIKENTLIKLREKTWQDFTLLSFVNSLTICLLEILLRWVYYKVTQESSCECYHDTWESRILMWAYRLTWIISDYKEQLQ